MKKKLNICIVRPNRDAFSETFIRNHIKYLPGNIFDLYGSWYPAFDRYDVRIAERFLKRNFFSKLVIFLFKIFPSFVSNRIPSNIKGYPYDEELNKYSFIYYLKQNKIDVVLAEFFLKGVVIKDICANLNIPFVVHTHGGGDIMEVNSLKMYSKSFPDLFKKVSKIISVDSFSSKSLLELGVPKKKLVEMGCGIDINLFSATKPSLNDPIFFTVGRLVNKKAPYLTILAFSNVVRIYPKAQLLIGGKGPLLDCCMQLVKSLKIENNVQFIGVLSSIEVAKCMRKSRAFVQHSVHTIEGDSEGMPVVILEAMACGLPVISTKHNGIADNINTGINGLLVEENDITTMADYMIKLIKKPLYADQLGMNARKKIEEDFELFTLTQGLYTTLHNVVQEYIRN